MRDKRRVAERERAAAARAVERERLTLRVVSLLEGGRMLLSDGRVIDSPGVSSAALAERLRRRRVSGGAVEAHELAILDAWRAFEGRAGGGT
ncbi:MAG TPA: hypothetical protein VLC53_04520 [Myxococcota bacterium]|nr:hypothetical protein [Myxococcota bacterium]